MTEQGRAINFLTCLQFGGQILQTIPSSSSYPWAEQCASLPRLLTLASVTQRLQKGAGRRGRGWCLAWDTKCTKVGESCWSTEKTRQEENRCRWRICLHQGTNPQRNFRGDGEQRTFLGLETGNRNFSGGLEVQVLAGTDRVRRKWLSHSGSEERGLCVKPFPLVYITHPSCCQLCWLL